jgi:hypothetical protein
MTSASVKQRTALAVVAEHLPESKGSFQNRFFHSRKHTRS